MELANDQKFWNNEQDRLFYEAFRKVLWRLCEHEKLAAKEGRGSRSDDERTEDLYDDLHRRLMRASTQHLLRQELIRILAEPPGRYSRPSTLRENPGVIWALVNDRHDWKKARDLALFALASYGQFRGRAASEGATAETDNQGE